ncbi:MAG: RIP metalloprotease RseP [Synechococcales cyanobacterium RM1_1_8]|nr:RIP metalloprotease RseP [Synechococcales cyanobacterium RM1_1_8]
MFVLAAVGVLALLIFVHELGHFLAARLQGIYANKFSIGFGPALLRYQGPMTEYALRIIPLGGYVGFPDEDPESDIDPTDPNLLQNRPILDRAIVISAGVIANLVFAYVILVSQVSIVGVMTGYNFEPGVVIPQVVESNSAATAAGLRSGDVVLQADGQVFEASENSVQSLINLIQSSAGKPLRFVVQRDGELIPLTVEPRLEEDGVGHIGVQLAPNGKPLFRRPNSLAEPFRKAAKQFEQLFQQIVDGFTMLVMNFGETAPQLKGPVKIVEFGADIARTDSGSLFFFAAFISINLAFINILPLPALDGGQLAFLLIEGLLGKPLPQKFQAAVMQTGLLVLLTVGVFLIIRDTTQLTWVQQFFPS